MYDTLTSRLGAPMHAKTPAWARSGTLQALLKVRLPYEKYATKVRLPAEAKATTPGAIKNFGDRRGTRLPTKVTTASGFFLLGFVETPISLSLEDDGLI